MMRILGKLVMQGLAALLPVTLTVYVILWMGGTTERWLGGLIAKVVPERLYVPGMGVVLGLAVVIGVGILMNAWVVRRLFDLVDWFSARIPLVKTIYGSVRDLMSFFADDPNRRKSQVVLVSVGGTDLLGVLTRETVEELPSGEGEADRAAVYLPMSYGIGGFTILVPRSALRPVKMGFEEAMRFAVTAGMSSSAPAGTGAAS